MATKKKAAVVKKPSLSGGSGQAGSGSDLKGGGGPSGSSEVKKPAAKKTK